MTTLIRHHSKTYKVALFETNGEFWIGSYFPQATHQNGEPPYLVITEVDSKEEGIAQLSCMSGDEC